MTKTVKIEMLMDIADDEKAMDKIMKLTHHIDWLLDLDGWSEIKSVYGVKIHEVEG